MERRTGARALVTADKPRLRSALKKLRRIEFDRSEWANVAMAPQEMLDFLAMTDGMKPLYLLGRGFYDPRWMSGVEALARSMRLHVLVGPKWQSEPAQAGLPEWFTEIRRPGEERNDRPVVYVCRHGAVAKELEAIASGGGATTVAQEARLLGYPPCCVREYYRRAQKLEEAFFLMVKRTARANPDEMRRIVVEDVELTPEAEEERILLEEATAQRSAPFTGVIMCKACASNPDSPAMKLSRRQEALARAVDRRLAEEVMLYQHAFDR